jgi:hypothetical protein
MKKSYPESYIPLVLRFHRLMDAFAKSDDERDFYLDRIEGFIIYVDLDKGEDELKGLEKELQENAERYLLIPKMTFFEVKKFMEGFVQEKVYDIDTKEKLIDIISGKEARENFLEFVYDHLNELEKWQLYYQERSRIRIIEWLRSLNVQFVFEEDLEISPSLVEKLKRTLFEKKVPKDVVQARIMLVSKAKSYYSNEALNPRPKRGRPPKQVAKVEVEPQFTIDIYTTVPSALRLFLYIPDITTAASVTFSSKFESEEKLLAFLRGSSRIKVDEKLEALSQRLASLEKLSQRIAGSDELLGIEKYKKALFPHHRPKMKGATTIQLPTETTAGVQRIALAAEEILPRKRGRPRKEEPEVFVQEKKRFAIKKVAPIFSSKKKKEE